MSEDQILEDENNTSASADVSDAGEAEQTEVEESAQTEESQSSESDAVEAEAEPEPEEEADPLENYSVDFLDIDALLKPISSGSPCGESARYEDEFEGLERQIKKLDMLDPNDPIDWGEVGKLSISLLTNKSKDLLMVSYLTLSLLNNRGYKGLEAGLYVYDKLLQQYWNDLFPPLKRVRGRIAAINWMLERVEIYINNNEAKISQKAVIQNAYQLTENIREFLNNNLDDNVPDVATVNGQLRGFINSFEAAERKQQQEADQRRRKEQQLKEERDKGGALATVVSESAYDVGANAIMNWVKSARDFLSEDAKGQLRAQWLNRISAWIRIKECPPITQGKTPMSPPTQDQLKDLHDKLANLQGVDALNYLEEIILSRPFWLDIYYHCWKVLDEMGSEYDYHKQSLEGDVAGFIGRFPEIADAQFRTGTPLADDDTRKWIDQITKKSSGGSGFGGGEPWLEAEKEAKKLGIRGKLSEALAQFREGQKSAQSKREEFLWRLRQSNFCLKMEQLELAIGQLEALEKEAQVYNLKEWEPQISVEVARLLLVGYGKYLKKKNKPMPEIKSKMQSLYRDICRLDINIALTLEDKSWQ